MNDKRLNELLRQRALIEEHIVWLDAEIDELQGSVSNSPSPVPANRLEPIENPSPAPEVALPPSEDDPNPASAIADIYEELGPETEGSAKDARKGCLMIFGIAFLALAGLATWVWLAY